MQKNCLKNKTVLVTRPLRERDELKSLLLEAGAEVLSQPTVEIRPPQSWSPIDAAIARISDFDWLVFASANGVDFFCERLLSKSRGLPIPQISAIGPGTALALEKFGLKSALIPTQHTSEGIVDSFISKAKAGEKILIVRASRGRNIIKEQLSAVSHDEKNIYEIIAYESVDITSPDPKIVSLLEQNRIDWVTCTSSAIAVSLFRMFGRLLDNTKIVSISPISSKTIRNLGLTVSVESSTANMQAVFDAIVDSEI